jgi:hypothetical protein
MENFPELKSKLSERHSGQPQLHATVQSALERIRQELLLLEQQGVVLDVIEQPRHGALEWPKMLYGPKGEELTVEDSAKEQEARSRGYRDLVAPAATGELK